MSPELNAKAESNAQECSATAALYSLGTLSEAESKQFEQRLASGCPFCLAEFESYSRVVEHLPLSIEQFEPSPSVRQRLLDRVKASTTQSRSGSPPPSNGKEPLSEATIVRGGDSPWIPLAIPGIEIRPLLGRKTLLIRMQAGSTYPEHEHHQVEQCYVLEGSVTDSDGVTANAGDFICMPSGITHRPIHTDSGCTFLIAYT
ncbi:MAG TPA: cupin domain-containing protein [Bryobacteraceae bacterium]|jgi:anti-sigma factor ChrR (cupin superfamily)|nr:cupin domain-containing protein [Bryobacteraceae bacterium]